MRTIFWFSHGAASTYNAIVGIEELQQNGYTGEIIIACILLANEHEDNLRYAKECEAYFYLKFGVNFTYLTRDKYANSEGVGDVDIVVQKTRYMSGPQGARCTKELKKQVRLDYQKSGDVHSFGFHSGESHRVDRVLDTENDLDIWCPLIEKGIDKAACLKAVYDLGIELPMMYRLGYNNNNNCKGCLKASGAGYWNKIRKDFPDVFRKRAREEELLGVSLVQLSANKLAEDYPEHLIRMLSESMCGRFKVKIDSRGTIRIPLRFLPPDAGDHKTEHSWECGIFCEAKT